MRTIPATSLSGTLLWMLPLPTALLLPPACGDEHDPVCVQCGQHQGNLVKGRKARRQGAQRPAGPGDNIVNSEEEPA